MLWICIHLPLLPLEVFTHQKQCGPLVVEGKVNNRRQVLFANHSASAAGILPGTSIQTALGLANGLEIKQKEEKSEWQTLEQLATWAYQFTPHITLKEHTLLLEVSTSLSLFNGKEALCKTLITGLNEWGYKYSLACCSTPKSAQLLAKHKTINDDSNNKIFFNTNDIKPCSIHLLDIPDKEKQQLKSMGITKIHHLDTLPNDAINRRFGTALSLQLQQITGEVADNQKSFKLPRTFDQSIHFVEELTQTHSLLFPLKRLFGYLENYLTARQLVCNSFIVTFHERFQQQHSLVMQLAQPHYRSEYLLDLVKLKLENLCLHQPVTGIRISARYFSPLTQQNHDLFGAQDKTHPSKNALIDTLKHRLGDNAIQGILLNNDHRPERAAQTRPINKMPSPPHRDKASFQTKHPTLIRPLWLFQTPQRLHNKKGVPVYGEQLQLIKGPERIETGWWDQQPINRDYYVAQHPTGAVYWIYVDRDKKQDTSSGTLKRFFRQSLQQTSPGKKTEMPHYTPKYQTNQWFLHGVFG